MESSSRTMISEYQQQVEQLRADLTSLKKHYDRLKSKYNKEKIKFSHEASTVIGRSTTTTLYLDMSSMSSRKYDRISGAIEFVFDIVFIAVPFLGKVHFRV